MSFYNIMNGVNPFTFIIMPIMFDEHPDKLPRFRDCSVLNLKGELLAKIITRTGGNNRHQFGDEIYENHSGFVKTVDAEDDNTYAIYFIKIPEKYQESILEAGKANSMTLLLEEHKEKILNMFPKIADELKKILY